MGSNPTLSAIPTTVDTAIGLIEDYDDPNERAKMDRQARNHTHAVENLRSAGIFHSPGNTPQMILNLTENHETNVNVSNIPAEELHDRLMKLINEP